jgi:hypothetical protein
MTTTLEQTATRLGWAGLLPLVAAPLALYWSAEQGMNQNGLTSLPFRLGRRQPLPLIISPTDDGRLLIVTLALPIL